MSIYQGSVMFWIHGGSYVTGGTKDMFNGTQLAKEFGVSRLESLGAHVCWFQSSTVFVIYRNMDFEESFTQIDFFMFL